MTALDGATRVTTREAVQLGEQPLGGLTAVGGDVTRQRGEG
jgi:hypothetical protein